MTAAEFDGQLDRYLLGELDKAEIASLRQAANEKSDWSNRFAKAEQLRHLLEDLHFTDDEFKSELMDARKTLFAELIPNRLQWLPMMAAACVSAIVVTALFLTLNQSENIESDPGQIVSTSIKYRDTKRIVLETTHLTERTIEGNLNQPEIRDLLMYTVRNDQNLGNRIDALNYLKLAQSEKPDPELGIFLAKIIKEEDNLPLKFEALSGLENVPVDPVIGQLYIDILKHEKNKLVKLKIIQMLLAQKSDTELDSLIRNLLKSDADLPLRSMLKGNLDAESL